MKGLKSPIVDVVLDSLQSIWEKRMDKAKVGRQWDTSHVKEVLSLLLFSEPFLLSFMFLIS